MCDFETVNEVDLSDENDGKLTQQLILRLNSN
jgi:hypothetical protein